MVVNKRSAICYNADRVKVKCRHIESSADIFGFGPYRQNARAKAPKRPVQTVLDHIAHALSMHRALFINRSTAVLMQADCIACKIQLGYFQLGHQVWMELRSRSPEKAGGFRFTSSPSSYELTVRDR